MTAEVIGNSGYLSNNSALVPSPRCRDMSKPSSLDPLVRSTVCKRTQQLLHSTQGKLPKNGKKPVVPVEQQRLRALSLEE